MIDRETQYLTFRQVRSEPSAKTRKWEVRSKRGFILGIVRWHGPWRQYVFAPENETIYNKDCMHEIADFCSDMTHDHRVMNRRRRS